MPPRSTKNVNMRSDEALNETQKLQILSDIRNKQSIVKSAGFFVGGAIFFDYLQRFLGGSIGATSRYLFFPFTIALSIVNNLYLARQISAEEQLQGKANPGTIANFAIEAVTSTLVGIALIGGAIAQSALFVIATPVMLLVSVGIKAVWDAAKGVANLAKAVKLESVDNRTDVEEMDRKESYKNGMYNLANAALTSLITVSIGLIMLSTGLAIWAAVGFAAGIVGSMATMVAKADRATVSTVERPSVVNQTASLNSQEELLSSTAEMSRNMRKTVNYGSSYFNNLKQEEGFKSVKVHTIPRASQISTNADSSVVRIPIDQFQKANVDAANAVNAAPGADGSRVVESVRSGFRR